MYAHEREHAFFLAAVLDLDAPLPGIELPDERRDHARAVHGVAPSVALRGGSGFSRRAVNLVT